MTFAISFAAGIFLSQYLLPLSWQLPACLLACGVGAAAYAFREDHRLLLLLIGVGLATSFSWNWMYTVFVKVPAEKLVGTESRQISMTLCGYASATSYGAKVTVEPQISGLHGVKAVYYGEKDLLDLSPGNVITDTVRLGNASRIREDDVTAFTSKGVFLLAYSRDKMTVKTGDEDSMRWWPLRVGHVMQSQIAKLFSGNTAGFLTAILTGNKAGLSKGATSNLTEAGLYHILAVSGMHCTFLLGIVTFLAGRHRRRTIAGVAAPLLVFYMLLTGGTPSVVRACIMLLFLLAAPLFYREGDPPTSLAAALMVILIKNPFAAASISLQLSFAAMAGIVWLTPRLARAFLHGRKGPNRGALFLAGSFSATMGALVFTIPLSAFYFNILVLVSPLSNLLCLWAASLIFSFGILAVLLSFLWFPLASLVGLIPKILIFYVLHTARFLSEIPYHAVYFSNPYLKFWLAFVYLLFFIAILFKPGFPRKYFLAAGFSLLTLLAAVRLGSGYETQGKMNITVLDVGQGECVLLSSKNEFALIDCGNGNSWYDAGKTASDILISMGCRKLRYLMLTHYDYDHVSGVTELMDRLPVETLLIPNTKDDNDIWEVIQNTAKKHEVSINYVTKRQRCTLGSVRISIYPPLGDQNDNERGLTYLCTSGNYDLLVTGDMSGSGEKKLIRTYALPDIEALVVGHHGSRTSTSEELLENLKPETAIISVGSNSYGHPAPETLRRLKCAGCKIYRTDLQGDVHITVN